MKNRRSLLILLIVFFGFQICIKAQDQYLLPGVTDNIVSLIQTQVNTVISDKYEVMQVLNIDSSLGSGLGPRWPDIGAIEDPYGTLTHCFIFNGTRKRGAALADSASGIVGVFKDGKILWHSDGLLSVKRPWMKANTIWTIKDINKDGEVEILTTWISSGSSSNPLMYLWIFSWDGQNGVIVNQQDRKQSNVIMDSNTILDIVDIEGDGIWEIQGLITVYEGDSTRSDLKTYSWNGFLYGLWPDTPQPPIGTIYPKNKCHTKVNAKIIQQNEKYQYQYCIENMHQSSQDIQEFAIDRLTDSVTFIQIRRLWQANLPWIPIISWRCDNLYGSNYIKIGGKDSNFVFYVKKNTLPKILKYYSQGFNGELSNDVISNSFCGTTIGPSNITDPFIPLVYIDTLIKYTVQSKLLGWIKDSLVANKYSSYFNTAKTSLEQNNIASTRTTLQQILLDVDIDSTSKLTSEAYALIRYNTEYLLEKLPEAAEPGCIVKLVNSMGSPLISGTLQYRDTTWKDAVNNNNGTFTINTTRKRLSLRMTYEYGTQTKTNVTVGTDTIVFQTVNTQVQFQSSLGNPIDTGIVQYYAGGWRDLGITANGVVTKELLPVRYTFRLTYNSASVNKAQNIDTNSIVIFQTTAAIVQLQTSTGIPLDTGIVQYYAGGWKDLGITSNGIVPKELLPARYNFRITYNSASKTKVQNLDTNSIVIFQTSNISVELRNSRNELIDTGIVQYYSGAWKDFGVTQNGIVSKELLPVRYTFRMTYAYANNQKVQNTDTNAVVTFQTVNAAAQLKNSQGILIDTGTVEYYAGGPNGASWKVFGTTENGIASKELLSNSYNFRMTYASISNTKRQNLDSSNTVNFSTVLCSVRVTHSEGQFLDNAIVTYYRNGWKPFGTTVNGMTAKELLPANITFRVQYGNTRRQKAQDINLNPNVEFSLP